MIEKIIAIPNTKDKKTLLNFSKKIIKKNIDKGIKFQCGNNIYIINNKFCANETYRISCFKNYENCIAAENHIEIKKLEEMEEKLCNWLLLFEKYSDCKLVVLTE